MIESKLIAITVSSDAIKTREMDIQVKRLDFKQRLPQAIRLLAIWGVAAIVAVLIPILHFFLVPALLLTGIGVFCRQLTLKHRLVAQKIPCPNCAESIALDTGSFNWPKRLMCPACQARLILQLVEPN